MHSKIIASWLFIYIFWFEEVFFCIFQSTFLQSTMKSGFYFVSESDEKKKKHALLIIEQQHMVTVNNEYWTFQRSHRTKVVDICNGKGFDAQLLISYTLAYHTADRSRHVIYNKKSSEKKTHKCLKSEWKRVC